MSAKVEALIPAIEAYIERGMTEFDNPALAIGIIADDSLVYAKGFGTRRGGGPVDTNTVFQIGSTTKAFLATTLAIGVDQGKFDWADRVVDLYPDFRMKDPWVTQNFLVSDLLAQHSGMPAYANDAVGFLGYDQKALIRSMRFVDPAYSFRGGYSYTNITHMLAQQVVASRFGTPDWDTVVQTTIFDPLEMTDSSFTAAAIEAATNATTGHLWTPEGAQEVPFTQIFPYDFGGAGALNSTIDDLSRWVRMHLGGGALGGTRVVSTENLAVTKTPRTAVNPNFTYAMGWVAQSTPNGRITWHNGGTTSYGAYIGTLLDNGVGVIVLTNQTNVGLPDAIGEWVLDRLLGNPEVDHLATKLASARESAAKAAAAFVAPADARPPAALSTYAGEFTNDTFGVAKTVVDGDTLIVELPTGARLRLTPWNADAFTVRLVAEGRFVPMVANLGPQPLGLAQFLVNGSGQTDRLHVFMQENGQSYDFVRKK